MKTSSSVLFLLHPGAPWLTPPLSGSTIVGFVAALNRWLQRYWHLWDELYPNHNTTLPFRDDELSGLLPAPVFCLGDGRSSVP